MKTVPPRAKQSKHIEEFTLNSEPFTVPRPATAQRIIDILTQYPDGRLLDVFGLAWKARLQVQTIRHAATHPDLAPLRQRVRSKNLWGNPRTIAALRAKLAPPTEAHHD